MRGESAPKRDAVCRKIRGATGLDVYFVLSGLVKYTSTVNRIHSKIHMIRWTENFMYFTSGENFEILN